jgi:Rrf2 family protein
VRVAQQIDYAVRGLVKLAAIPGDEYLRAADIANDLGMPKRFFEQQIAALARADLVQCRRGRAGGCRLARPAAEISLADIIVALEGEVLDVPRVTGSAASEAWQGAASALEEHLAGVNLEGLAARQTGLDASSAAMYHI